MPEQFDSDTFAHAIADTVTNLREGFAPLAEAALGYRTNLVEQGWSAASAESMAVEYYRLMIGILVKGF
jgi:hypothetical protein